MAYRAIHTTFWNDPFIESLSIEERYLYIYFMTNSKTTQCGCYEISLKFMQYESNVKQEEIETFLKKMEKENKIIYNKENQEILIKNWLKHNSFSSPKIKSCIMKELKKIKTEEFLKFINDVVNLGNVDAVKKEELQEESEDFKKFWELYDKPFGRNEAVLEFEKLSKQEKQIILSMVKEYVKNTPDVQYRQNATRWIKEKSWKDMKIPVKKEMTKNEKIKAIFGG